MYENDGKQFQQDKETGPSPNIEKKTCAKLRGHLYCCGLTVELDGVYEGAAGAAAGPDAALLREEVVGVAAAAAVREEQAARGRLVEVEPGTNHSSVLQPSANRRSVL